MNRIPHSLRFLASLVVTLVALAVAPSVVAAQPPPSVGELRARARSIASELQRLSARSDNLDEAYLEAKQQLADLRSKLGEKEQAVAAAEQELGDQRTAAKSYAVAAFVSGGRFDPVLMPASLTDDVSTRAAYLESLQGDREQVIDDVRSARIRLDDERTKLDAAKAAIDAKVASLDQTRNTLQGIITKQQALQDSISGELAQAVAAEQARLAAAREAAAERAARAEAERAARAAARSAAAVPSRRDATEYLASSGSATTPPRSAQGASRPNASTDVAFPDPGPGSPGAASAIAAARGQLGVPYRWGASSPGVGFDCSGLVMYAWGKGGKSLPHSSRALFAMSQRISADQLQPGDLVFGGSPVHHVGLYVGSGLMVHAPHSGDVVKISSIYGTSSPVRFGRI